MVRYIDLAFPVKEGMPFWPGDSGPEFREVKSQERDGYAIQTICFSNQLGTHLDAPSHVVRGGMTLDRIPLETLIGKAVILDFAGKRRNERITRKEFQPHGDMLRPGARVLIWTG